MFVVDEVDLYRNTKEPALISRYICAKRPALQVFNLLYIGAECSVVHLTISIQRFTAIHTVMCVNWKRKTKHENTNVISTLYCAARNDEWKELFIHIGVNKTNGKHCFLSPRSKYFSLCFFRSVFQHCWHFSAN